MTEAIICGVISAIAVIVASAISSNKTRAIIEYRIDKLEEKVDKHNQLIDRMYAAEDRLNVQEEKIKVANNRIKDLEEAK